MLPPGSLARTALFWAYRLANLRFARVWAHSSSHASIARLVMQFKLRPAIPFFRSLGRVFAKVKKLRSLTVTVDPSLNCTSCMSLFRQSMGCIGKYWRLRFEDRAFPFPVLTCRIIDFPLAPHVTMSKLCPVPQQSRHQIAEDSRTSCHANPTRAASPKCTKLVLRPQVHQCTLSHNRMRVSSRVNQGRQSRASTVQTSCNNNRPP